MSSTSSSRSSSDPAPEPVPGDEISVEADAVESEAVEGDPVGDEAVEGEAVGDEAVEGEVVGGEPVEVGADGEVDASTQQSRWPLVLAAVAVVVAAALGVRVVQLMGERDDLEQQNADLVESLRIARGDAGEQIDALEAEIAGLTGDLETSDAELEATVSDLDRVRTERNQVTSQLADRTAELEEASERLDEIDARLEELGHIEPMPELVGIDLAEAQEFADDLDAILLVEEVAPSNVIARPGAIIEQRPEQGVPLVAGSVIWVQVFTLDDAEPDTEQG